MTETIIILDFGSPHSQLIARRVREAQVYAELLPWDAPEDAVLARNPEGFILSGGLHSSRVEDLPALPGYVLESGFPILAIGDGSHVLVRALGGEVKVADERKYELAELKIISPSRLLYEGDHPQVWMCSRDCIESLPEGFNVLAETQDGTIAGIGDDSQGYYGLQFHPEVHHTPAGRETLKRFVIDVCRCAGDWTAQSMVAEAVRRIRSQVGDARALSAVSGGVDSSVATALVRKAIGAQLSTVFVDTGLMRQDEGAWVQSALRDTLGEDLHVIDAKDVFFEKLKGVTDPEKKRIIIGETFIRIFESTARQLGSPPYLVQGTIYPDVIESRDPDGQNAGRIKSHHNVGGLPDAMEFELVEPLRFLFKDEVRKVGEALRLPHALVNRQPFPGPGLAVRCVGEVTPERVEKLRRADAIFISELEKEGFLGAVENEKRSAPNVAQAFAVLLPVRSVGVTGDQRTYDEVIALRAVTSEDFMTADWARLPSDLLDRAAHRIVSEVEGVNRVVYDITSKPPGTIEWE